MSGTIDAFDQGLVSRITRLSRRQLEYWDQIGLVRPSIAAHDVDRLPRLYSFRDLLKLKVAAEMRRRHVRPSEIKARVNELENRGIADPLLTLRIVGDPAGETGRAFWIDPSSNAPMSWKALDQHVAVYDLQLQDLRSGLTDTIRRLLERKQGPPEKIRGVQGSDYVIAGTRVPTRKVAALVEDGWTANDVVTALPHLTRADVRRAVTFERERRRRSA